MSNPYESPQAAPPQFSQPKPGMVGQGPHGKELAGLGLRLAGALLDGIINAMVIMPIMFLVLLPLFGMNITDPNLAYNVPYIATGYLLGTLVLLAIHGYLLATRGQTVGKLILKTQIVSQQTGEIPAFGQLFAMRYLLPGLFYNVPIVGGFVALVNALMIFRENRKCLHDEIAGTQVIKLEG